MNNGFLSQEEINSLLSGETSFSESNDDENLTDRDIELLCNIGAASMEAASQTLAMITNLEVNIKTPVVMATTLSDFKESIDTPYMSLEVKYVSGISGTNLLINKIKDAQVIANLMMGGNGIVETEELSELEESAVSEAMNQMIGSAATSMAGILSKAVNISPPTSKVWKEKSEVNFENIDMDQKLIKISYSMTIGDLVDSDLIQLFPFKTGREIVEAMEGKENKNSNEQNAQSHTQARKLEEAVGISSRGPETYERPIEKSQPQVEVHQASFQPLTDSGTSHIPKNIDLILDVPLEISVVLGRTKKCIKDILNLGTGSLLELDKLAEEPVEILVNGKRVAFGEVVVVGENFGVRVTNIVSNIEKVKSLER